MGLKSAVFMALVAYAYSGPVNLNRQTSTSNTCAQQCTDKSKFQYTPGTVYEFTYEGETKTGIQGASEDKAGLKITTTAEIEVISKCDLVLTLRDAAVFGSDPDSSRNLHRKQSPEFSQALEQNPLWFSFQDGIVEELCPSNDDSTWALNIKRGILSAFQNTMNSFENNQELTETDVNGKCKTTYTMTQQGWRTISIKKSKDMESCTDRHGYETALQSTLYRLPSSMQSMPLMQTTHECDQVINTDGHIQSVLCHEIHLFRPFSKENSGAMTEVTQKLNFVRTKSNNIVSSLDSSKREKLTFQHTGGDSTTKTTDYQSAVDKLQELCQNTQDEIRPNTPQIFSELVYLMKNLNADSLNSVYNQVNDPTFCPNNAERTKKFYLDAVPMVGTGAAVRQITKLIKNKKITGVFAEMWLASLAFIHHPTKEMISEISILLTTTEVTKALLPISALINSYCNDHPQCAQEIEVDSVITTIEGFLGGNCDVTTDTYSKVLLSLRAIGNIGHAQRMTVVLDNCFAKKDNPMEIRVAAVDAYRRLSCGADRNNLMILYRDSDEDSELRIAAYLQIMKCPNEYIISQIKEELTAEEVNQVGSFVWTHLTNVMESSALYKQSISSILQDERLKKEFDLDKRKFSRNYEWSYFSEKYNAGAGLESNFVWSTKSFIPRSVMANLTIDMFGHSVNLLEIGGRVEGLEHLLEAYFGPTGIYNMEDGEDDSVPPESTSRDIKMAKLNKINNKFGAKVDDLKAAVYMRMFGNEVKYACLGDKTERSSINMVDILMKLAKQREISHSMNDMFLDSSIIIPTMLGLPLNLTVNGTSTINLKTTGKMDLQHGNRILIQGSLKPSGAVQISSIMSVDAFVTKSGMKMSSTLHSSTAIEGTIQFTNKQVLKVEIIPKERMEILNLETSFFAIHADQERRQDMIAANRIDNNFCMGHTFARVTGVDICSQLQYPNTTDVDDAPYFPFSGPLSFSITMLKRDTHTAYKFVAEKVKTRQKFKFSVNYDTPGSTVDRATGFDVEVNHKRQSMEINMLSPWKKARFTGDLGNTAVLKKVTGTLTVDDTKEYSVLAQVRKAETKNAITYTPNVEIRIPNRDAMTLTGSILYKKKKSLDSSIKINNVIKDPIIFDSSIKYTDKEVGVSGTFSYQKDKEYSMESRVLMSQKKKKSTYNPIFAISTPKKDLIGFRGFVDFRSGKAVKFDLTLDKVFTVPVSLKGDGSVYQKGTRTRYKGRYTFTGPRCNKKMRFNFDKRANVVSTMIQTNYNFAKYFKWAKDTLKFSSKFVNKASKTTKVVNLDTNFKSSRFGDYNNRVIAKLVHRRNKQTQFNSQMHYGKKYTRKDNKKFIALDGVSKYRAAKVGLNADYNVTFRYPFKNWDAIMTGNHQHNRKLVRHTMKMQYNQKKNVDISIQLNDKSKRFPKYSGDFSLKYDERHIVVGGQIAQDNARQRSVKLSVQHQTDQTSTFDGVYKRKSDTEHEIKSNIAIYNKKPIALTTGADFTMLTPKLYTDVTYGRNSYGWNFEGEYDNGTYAKLITGIKYPSNQYSLEMEGGKVEEKYMAKFLLDKNQDENNRYHFEGAVTNGGITNFEGLATFQIPGHLYSANVRHQGGELYRTHVDAAWAPGKRVTADLTLSDDERRHRRTTEGSFTLTTPFQRINEFKLAAGHTSNRRQYSSHVSVSLNRQPYRLDFTTKKPLSINDLDMQVSMTTPSRKIGNPSLTIRHVLNSELMSSASVTWGEGHTVTVDVSGNAQYARARRNLIFNVGVTTNFQGYESMVLNVTHNDDLNQYTTKAVFDHNGIQYLYTLSMDHTYNGWQIQNSGVFDINSPYDTLNIKWSHRNSDHDYRSSASADWGNGQKFTALLNGEVQFTSLSRRMVHNFNIQIPSERVRSLTGKFEHEDRKGYIKSEASVLKNGRNAGTVAMNYNRLPGSVDFDFAITSIYMEDFTTKIKTRHAASPFTGQFSVEWAPMQKIELDGTYNYLMEHRFIDSKLVLRTPFQRAREVVVTYSKKLENLELVETTVITYAPRQKIVRETRMRWDTEKMFREKITTPFPQFTDLDYGFYFRGDKSNFEANADFKVIPYLQKVSVESSWIARRLKGNFMLRTPFQQYPYMSAAVSSGQLGQARTSKIVVEYLPMQKVEIDTSYSLTGQELDATLDFKSPFTGDVYSSYKHGHTDKSFKSHAEILYKSNQRIILDAGYDLEPTISGSFQMTSPLRGYETVKLAFNHDGNQWHNFHTNASYQTNDDKLELEAMLNLVDGYKGRATFRSPFSVNLAQAAFNHEGNLMNFKTHGEVSYKNSKAESDVTFSHDEVVTTGLFVFKNSFSLALTPDIHVSFGKDGSMSDLTLSGELGYGEKKFTGTATHQMALNDLTSTITINTPYTKSILGKINHDTRRKGFQTIIEGSIGNDNSIRSETTFKLRNYHLDLKQHVTGVLDGENQDLLITISHDGKPVNFNNEISGTYNTKSLSAVTKFDVRSLNSIKISSNVKTPFEGYTESSAKFTHVKTDDETSIEIVGICGGKKISMIRSTNGISMDNFVESVIIRTPFEQFSEYTSRFSSVKDSSGYTIVYTRTMNGQETECRINYDIDDIKNLHGSVNLKLPIPNYEIMSASFRSNVRDSGYSGEALASLNDEQFSAVVTAEGTTFDSHQSKVAITTPMEGYETMSASLKTKKRSSGYTGEAIATLKDQQISVDINADGTTLDNLQGKVTIKTPIENYDSMDAGFRTVRTPSSIAVEMTSSLKNKRFTVDMTLVGTTIENVNGKIAISTPIENYETMSASFTSIKKRSGYSGQAAATLKDQEFNIDIAVDGTSAENLQSSVTMSTPIQGYSTISAFFKSIKDSSGMNNEVSVTYADGKTVRIQTRLDLESPKISGNFHLETPFEELRSADSEFSHQGSLNNFQCMFMVKSSRSQPFKTDILVKLPEQVQFEGIEIRVALPKIKIDEQWDNVQVALKTDKKSGEYSIDASFQENGVKKMTMLGSWMLNTRRKSSILSSTLTLTTPFDIITDGEIKLDHFFSASRVKEIMSIEYNGQKYLDIDARLDYADAIDASINVRQPKEMEYTLTASKSGRTYSGNAKLNFDATNSNSRITIEGSFDEGSSKEPFRDISLRVIHPSRTLSLRSNFRNSRDDLSTSMDFSWDEQTSKSVGYDFLMSESDGKEYSLKVKVPSRSVKVTGRFVDGSTKTMESKVYWDVDRDDNKRVGVTIEKTHEQNGYSGRLDVELPSLGKDLSLRRNVRNNDGNIWHACRTEFSYSRDPSKTLIITSRIEDQSLGNTKNYTYAVGIEHAHSNIDMSFSAHVGNSEEKATAGLSMNYLTSTRQTKNLLLISEIYKLRKQLQVQVFTPEKSISLTGQLQDTAPYSLHLIGMSGSDSFMDTKTTIDPTRKRVDFRMKYDTENPNSVLHMSVRYPSPMDIEAEMYRTGDFRQVTDSLMTIHLKSTRLLHTKLHWRPEMMDEVLDYGSAMARRTGEHVDEVLAEVSREIGAEIEHKVNAISGELTTELKPITDILNKELTRLQNQLNKLRVELRQMYKRNALYMQDVDRLANAAVGEFISNYGVAMRKFKKSYRDMRSKLDEMTNSIQNYPVRETLEEYLNMASTKINEYSIQAQLFIDEEIELAVEKLKQLIVKLKERLNTLSNTVEVKITELMDEVSQHPDFQEIKAELEALLASMPELPDLPDFDYRQYINKVHDSIRTALRNVKLAEYYQKMVTKGQEFLNNHLGNLQSEEKIQRLKELSRDFYEQAIWAYRYLALEEYARELMEDLYNSTKKFISEDIAQLRILHWDKSRIISFDPVNGNLEAEFYLPTSVEALDRLPKFNYIKYINRIKNFVERYLPEKDFCLWDLYYKYKPSLNPRDWIPPFDSYAVVSGGQHFVTFDKEHFDFIGRCSYVLARDLIDNNFTVILNYNGNARNPKMESLLVMAEGQTVELFPDFTIKANERRHELPFIAGRLSVERIGNQIRLNSGRGLTITGDLIHDHFVISISGWYFGKVAGLLGTYNNEQYDDMVLSNGQLTTDLDQFKTSWEVARRCRNDRNLAQDIPVSESARGYEECSALFKSQASPLRSCYKQLDPESFMHICLGDHLSDDDVCKSTSLYVQSCQLQGVNLWLPEQCVKCNAPNDEVYLGGDTIKLSPSDDDYHIPQSADVVFVVERRSCNQQAARKLGNLVYEIDQGLNGDAVTDNRYGLISFGRESLHGHTIEGQLFNDATKFAKGVESLQFGYHKETDPLSAILSASNFPFRSGVSKSIVLLHCGECSSSEKTNPIYVKHVLHTRDITLHILRDQDFRLSGNQSPKQKILGMDNNRKYVLRQPKDMTPYDDLVIPVDSCADLALKSNGSLFDSTGFTLPKIQDKKEFLSFVSESVSKSAIPSDCQICQCVADDTGAAMPVCRRCYSSISDYIPSWWSTLKSPAIIQDAFAQQFQEYLGDDISASLRS